MKSIASLIDTKPTPLQAESAHPGNAIGKITTNSYKKYLDEITIVDAHPIKTTAILHDQWYSRVLIIEFNSLNGEDS